MKKINKIVTGTLVPTLTLSALSIGGIGICIPYLLNADKCVEVDKEGWTKAFNAVYNDGNPHWGMNSDDNELSIYTEDKKNEIQYKNLVLDHNDVSYFENLTGKATGTLSGRAYTKELMEGAYLSYYDTKDEGSGFDIEHETLSIASIYIFRMLDICKDLYSDFTYNNGVYKYTKGNNKANDDIPLKVKSCTVSILSSGRIKNIDLYETVDEESIPNTNILHFKCDFNYSKNIDFPKIMTDCINHSTINWSDASTSKEITVSDYYNGKIQQCFGIILNISSFKDGCTKLSATLKGQTEPINMFYGSWMQISKNGVLLGEGTDYSYSYETKYLTFANPLKSTDSIKFIFTPNAFEDSKIYVFNWQ